MIKNKRNIIIFTLIVATCLFLLFSGCSKPPQIKFCETFDSDKDLLKMWNNSKNTIEFNKLNRENVIMMIFGKLPLGEIQIAAVANHEGLRKKAIVIPESFENSDPDADLRAKEIHISRIRDNIFAEPSKDEQLGDFDIYLHQNGQEIAKTKIIIK